MVEAKIETQECRAKMENMNANAFNKEVKEI
jgi:hypothetical protein